MSKQTINIGASPNDGTGTPLRTSFDYTNQNFTEIYTALGGGVALPGATTQVIFNDGGTNLAGDAGLVYNKTTDALTVAGLVTAGSATITGDLTVRTNKLIVNANGVGAGKTPSYPLDVGGSISMTGAGTGSRYVALLDETNTYAGNLILQAGGGSAAYGGAITMYGHSHATYPGSVLIARSCGASGPIMFGSCGTNTTNLLMQLDSGGVCTWLDGASGTRMTLNSTGLGIGEAASVSRFQSRGSTSDSSAYVIYAKNSGGNVINFMRNDGRFIVGNGTTDNLIVTETGNVGIGVTPSAWGNLNKVVQVGQAGSVYGRANLGYYGTKFNLYNDNTDDIAITSNWVGEYRFELLNGSHVWLNKSTTGTINVAQTLTQAMTLDASGNLLVGTTTSVFGAARSAFVATGANGAIGAKVDDTGRACLIAWNADTSGDNSFIQFFTEAALTSRGSISYNRAGGLVAYNVTSDYRSKDILGPVSNSGSLIDSLKVYLGKMKGATIARPMLIAHEAQEVAPYSVTGIKDEVDADGKDKYQQMDVSSFVPLLIAEIQSLRARVQTLEAR